MKTIASQDLSQLQKTAHEAELALAGLIIAIPHADRGRMHVNNLELARRYAEELSHEAQDEIEKRAKFRG